MLRHLRVFECHPGLFAFYDGRVDGHRFAPYDNWVDDGALSLGIASYVLVNSDQAIVYDSHVSVPHGQFIRAWLAARGVNKITVVLSHWHLDHVAGTEAFVDCPIIANPRTLEHLSARKTAIEAGSNHGLPAINPLILPNQIFDGQMALDLAGERIELLTFNIHSDDATVIWLPQRGILLAGDTVEDCVTYVGEPESFAKHLDELVRMAALAPTYVLPNHGAPDIIAAGGYSMALIIATAEYTAALMENRAATDLKSAIAPHLAAGTLRYFPPYEAVHAQNLRRAGASWLTSSGPAG